MMLSAGILATIKIITLTVLAIFNVLQYINIWVHRKGNGFASTRKAMFVLTMALMFDALYFLIGDLHELFAGVPRHDWFAQTDLISVVLRTFTLYAIWRLYSLLYDRDNS